MPSEMSSVPSSLASADSRHGGLEPPRKWKASRATGSEASMLPSAFGSPLRKGGPSHSSGMTLWFESRLGEGPPHPGQSP